MEVKKYQKGTEIVEAVKCDTPNFPAEIADWCGGGIRGVGNPYSMVSIEFTTPKGGEIAHYGEYIIKDQTGHFYLCTPEELEKSYKPLEELTQESK